MSPSAPTSKAARWEGWKLHLEYSLALPAGLHLGTSASIDVAWLALTNGLTGRKQSSVALVEAAYHLETMLGLTGGKQDQRLPRKHVPRRFPSSSPRLCSRIQCCGCKPSQAALVPPTWQHGCRRVKV